MRDKLLEKCLKSLKENVDLPYRVIIINDGKSPLSFKDNRIKVVNSPKRMTGGEKKRLFKKLVKTEFHFRLDNDMLVRPKSLEYQVEALDRNPRLAAVSGIRFEKGIPCCLPGVSDFRFFGKYIMKKKYTSYQVLSRARDIFEADFVPTGHTTFRRKALDDITYDPSYKLGYAHWDTFLQFYFTGWKCAVHKKSHFDDIHHESPPEYKIFRSGEALDLIEQSRRHFLGKWGYRPVDVREKTLIGKVFFGISYLNEKSKCPSELRSKFSLAKIFKTISKLVH